MLKGSTGNSKLRQEYNLFFHYIIQESKATPLKDKSSP